MVYLIMCRSLTQAQQLSKALERAGIGSSVLRVPAEISPAGCGYGVKITARNLQRTLQVISSKKLPHQGVYVESAQFGYREVEV